MLWWTAVWRERWMPSFSPLSSLPAPFLACLPPSPLSSSPALPCSSCPRSIVLFPRIEQNMVVVQVKPLQPLPDKSSTLTGPLEAVSLLQEPSFEEHTLSLHQPASRSGRLGSLPTN
ncbi:uncharacterized protein LOC135112276 [Scylla paramamosain]|uniref:uncharacterized protein LOC135112276 n=1 Tax=Scylla paramamosain TaxID=85552 RepID=UPI0030835CF1